jgi:hypothetical protein
MQKSANVWKIGLYTKMEKKEEAECNICKNGNKKYTISTKNCSTAGLITHLKSKHKETEYYTEYEELEKSKKNLESNRTMNKFVNVVSGGKLHFSHFSFFHIFFRRPVSVG